MGATATGKSDLAVALAQAFDGEVVNADASQLYRGMDIGTAKLGVHDRGGVVHHLLDVLEVTEAASVAAYQRDARRAIASIIDRGRVAILVGGSGLYVKAVVDQLVFPGTDPEIRSRYDELAERIGARALHEELARRDPVAARAIIWSNTRRVVRALEVGELTGAPFTAVLPHADPFRPTVQIGLRCARTELDERIARRVQAMITEGLLDEVIALQERGIRDGPTAGRALGYAQLLDHLSGTIGLDQAIEDTIRATRAFARRQEKWFRRDPRITWLDGDPGRVREAAIDRVGRALGR